MCLIKVSPQQLTGCPIMLNICYIEILGHPDFYLPVVSLSTTTLLLVVWNWLKFNYQREIVKLSNFHSLDTVSLTIITGNATFPSSNNTTNHLPSGGELAGTPVSPGPPLEDDQGWEHLTTALIAIVAGVISFLTIVGNIMVSKILNILKSINA